MLFNFANILLFLLIAFGFVFVSLFAGSLFRPHNPTPEKLTIYECGEKPIGPGFTQFNLRFYLVAFVFLIFDVEVAFLYPVAQIFKEMLHNGWGVLAFVEIAVFVLILLVGFVYAWREGGLEWILRKEQDTKSTK